MVRLIERVCSVVMYNWSALINHSATLLTPISFIEIFILYPAERLCRFGKLKNLNATSRKQSPNAHQYQIFQQ